jgi:radical SAM superfamily enzyme YgiQ (UPF0313 family)
MVFDLIKEKGIIKKDWRKIDLTFGLVYPNRYKLGISSYSIRLLYHFINSIDNIVCERFFLPDKVKYPASKDFSSWNSIRSVETSILPNEFDILGFSVHFENDLKNILWFLDKAEIPIYSESRNKKEIKDNYRYPLLVAGGPAITSNPLPLSKIIDCFFIGDAEPNLYEFLKRCIEYKSQPTNYLQFLQKLAQIDGVFIPKINNPAKRIILKNLDLSPIPTYQLLVNVSSESNVFEQNYFVEINRGCPFKCKFCISSYHNFPFRNRSYEEIIKFIDSAINTTKFEKFSLIGSCVSSHPHFMDICYYIIKKGKKFSMPSIRVDHITPQIIELLEKGNIKTITIAPEAGSDSLRFEIGKRISNEKIFEILRLIKASKIKNIKLYFLIGLPNETEEDIKETIDLIKNIDNLGFNKGELRIKINPFIPKLNTPYQTKTLFYTSENFENFRTRFQYLIDELKAFKSVKLRVGDIKNELNEAKMQTLISLGDQSVTDLLIEYYLNGATRVGLRNAERRLNYNIDEYFKKIHDNYNPWNFEMIEK